MMQQFLLVAAAHFLALLSPVRTSFWSRGRQ